MKLPPSRDGGIRRPDVVCEVGWCEQSADLRRRDFVANESLCIDDPKDFDFAEICNRISSLRKKVRALFIKSVFVKQ